MKFNIDKTKLVEALQLIAGAVEKRQTLAILSNILIEVSEEQLHMVATDLEVELSVVIKPDTVTNEGVTTVPARKFIDIVKSLPDDKPISLTLNDNRLTIQSGRSRFTLQTLPANDFPHVEEGVGTARLSIPCSILSEMIDRTQFAMAQQDVRYYLNGMFFEIDGTQLRTVATDGHRLALSEWQLPDSYDIGVIVPRKGMLELGRLVSGRSSEVELVIGTNHLRAQIDGISLTSKLVDGKFPDYQRVIPRDTDKEVFVDRAQLKEGLQRAAILSNEKFKGVKLQLNENDSITLLSNNPEQEEAEIHIPAETEAYELEIGFNVQYLLDVVNSCREQKVKILLGDVNSSALIQEVGESKALYVVMPMRL